MQRVFHLHQPLAVFGAHPRQGNAGHFRDDFSHDLLIDDPIGFTGLLPPLLGHLLLFLFKFVGLVAESGSLLEVLIGNRFFLLLIEPFNLVVDLLEIRRLGHRLESDPGPRLVNHVNRLVRQAAASDVAAGKFHRCLEGIIGDRHPVVAFVTVPQPLEDFDRLALGGRFDHHQLKAAVESRVFLDVLAVLVERGRPNALDFTTGQSRLEHVGSVDGPLRSAGTDEGVEFVNEQNGVFGSSNFVHDSLDPFLELAAVLCSGDHHGEVEHHDPSVGQQFWNVALNDPLGKALNDRCLANARLADQYRVVLGAAAEDLDGPLDFLLTPNHRVELALLGQFGQISAERVEGGRLALATLGRGVSAATAGAGHLASAHARPLAAFVHTVAKQVEYLFADVLELEAEVHEYLGRDALLLPQQAQQDVLGTDVVVIEVAGLLHRILNDFFGPRSLGQFAHRDHVRAALDELFDLHADLAEVDVEVLEDVRGNAAALLDEAEQNMFSADVLVVEPLGLLVGQLHHLAGAIRKSFVHESTSCKC